MDSRRIRNNKMGDLKHKVFTLILLISTLNLIQVQGGIIKDVFKKITNIGNKTDDVVKQSAPICGSALFSSSNEGALSPEFIFITDRSSVSQFSNNRGSSNNNRRHDRNRRDRNGFRLEEVAREYRFNVENVTLQDLVEHGFNTNAPVTFLMHGFTSGYPLQAWMSAIVEAYTIDRETAGGSGSSGGYDQGYDYNQNGASYTGNSYDQGSSGSYGNGNSNYNQGRDSYGNTSFNQGGYNNYNSGSSYIQPNQYGRIRNKRNQNSQNIAHNLFVINWNYAARGIVYPRAVANIPIVATFATRFINDKLLGEAGIEGSRIQLIGHSLGAHLAGFIGKNTRQKLGRIYGLDPAGPCFGSFTGPLYPASKRLAPDDADEVITIHTNTALLGIDKAIGRYSVFVEGGSVQPGCKGGGVLKSIGTLTYDGGDFDTIACSHSRAPNLLTFRHDQSKKDDCQLIAYECKDWKSFQNGQCGLCKGSSAYPNLNDEEPFKPVECIRIGLEWQYPDRKRKSSVGSSSRPKVVGSNSGSYSNSSYNSYDKPYNSGNTSNSGRLNDYENNYDNYSNSSQYNQSGYGSSTRRPEGGYNGSLQSSSSPYVSGSLNNNRDRETNSEAYNSQQNGQASSNRRPSSSNSSSRNRRGLLFGSNDKNNNEDGRRDGDSKAISMYMRTGDTQPYCIYHYQILLELNQPFPKNDPPMSLLLQDSSPQSGSGSLRSSNSEQNSLSNDEFGHKFNDRIYTHLLTSGKKLKRIDLATLLFRNGLPDGNRILKSIHINYMSHIDPQVRSKLSSKLCLVQTDTVKESDRDRDTSSGYRYYFRPCDRKQTQGQGYTNQGYSNQGYSNQGYSNQGPSSSSPTSSSSSYSSSSPSSSYQNGGYTSNNSGSYQQTSRRPRN